MITLRAGRLLGRSEFFCPGKGLREEILPLVVVEHEHEMCQAKGTARKPRECTTSELFEWTRMGDT